jgi:hypothetical protein
MTPTEVCEMRKAITNAAFRGERLTEDGKLSLSPPLVRNVLVAAEQQGLSGEDTMTWLAYEALKGYERCMDQLIETAMLSPLPPIQSLVPPPRKP